MASTAGTTGAQFGYAFMTLLTGVGLGKFLPSLPVALVNLFDNNVGRLVLLVLLLKQAGQSWQISIVAALIFYVVVSLWKKLERKRTSSLGEGIFVVKE